VAQTPAQRRAAQRRLAREIRTGTYKPSQAGKKARETARRLRESQAGPKDGEEVFVGGQKKYEGIRVRIKRKKRQLWEDTVGFRAIRSDNAVDNSDDTTEMGQVEYDPEDRWLYLASQASYAQMAVAKTGDAGELEIYLPYAFLFYH
jgi:hypothetical protein